MKRAAIYIRVSTQEQADEGYSIPEQTERLKKYCEAMKWTVAQIYTDGGFTGANINRPALSRLISDTKAGLVDIILVYKLDRLSRSQKDTLYLIEDVFLKNNVEFVSMCENFDTSSPFGRAMIGILSVFAQLEREQIKERLAMGHIGRAKEGYWRGGSGAPIGYDYVENNLIVNEYEALQVREIFDLFLQGNSMHGICDTMRSKYNNKYSSWNNHGTIAKILQNTIYIGMIKYKGKEYSGQHDPVVSENIFNATQIKLKEYQNTFTEHYKTPFRGSNLLSGLVFCGTCGARYFVTSTMSKKHGTYQYYKCYSRDGNRQMKKADGCKNPNYKKSELDDIILGEILELAYDESEIDNKANGNFKPSNKSDALKTRISEIGKQIGKLMDLYQIGSIPLEQIGERAKSLNKEREVLEAEMQSGIEPVLLSTAEAKKIIRKAEKIIKGDDLLKKRQLVDSIINKIVIYPTEIEIFWKFA